MFWFCFKMLGLDLIDYISYERVSRMFLGEKKNRGLCFTWNDEDFHGKWRVIWVRWPQGWCWGGGIRPNRHRRLGQSSCYRSRKGRGDQPCLSLTEIFWRSWGLRFLNWPLTPMEHHGSRAWRSRKASTTRFLASGCVKSTTGIPVNKGVDLHGFRRRNWFNAGWDRTTMVLVRLFVLLWKREEAEQGEVLDGEKTEKSDEC